jgi:uncharacterized protein YcbK (DUF882 family)
MNPVISRRVFLGASLAASGALMVPALARAGGNAAPAARRLRLYNTHTSEALDITYFEQGVYHHEALTEIDFLLRDFRANAAVPMARGVIDLMHDLTVALETAGPVHIICGYRSAQTNMLLRRTGGGGVAKHSLHMDGMAIDLRVPGRRLAQVRAAASALGRGGVGYYGRENFVHIDTGRVRHWG